jgi:hypothetical protein
MSETKDEIPDKDCTVNRALQPAISRSNIWYRVPNIVPARVHEISTTRRRKLDGFTQRR